LLDAAVAQVNDAIRARGDFQIVRDITSVSPLLRTNPQSKSRMVAPVFVSRFPVGSSASNNTGLLASARAIATRCFSPPDNSLG
jgi:hypothetical protein